MEVSGRIIITFNGPTQTDGDPENWPELRPREVEADGTVDYLAPADKETSKMWKERIATGLCIKAGLPTSSVPTLADFPSGYTLLTHYKGDKDSPRRDTYLYGSRYVQVFRSPAEFFLHAEWLLLQCPRNEDGTRACGCVYCKPGVVQSEVSLQYFHRKVQGKQTRSSKNANTTTTIQMKDYTGIGGAAYKTHKP